MRQYKLLWTPARTQKCWLISELTSYDFYLYSEENLRLIMPCRIPRNNPILIDSYVVRFFSHFFNTISALVVNLLTCDGMNLNGMPPRRIGGQEFPMTVKERRIQHYPNAMNEKNFREETRVWSSDEPRVTLFMVTLKKLRGYWRDPLDSTVSCWLFRKVLNE